MNTNMKTLSIASSLALALGLLATAPTALAQVSYAQVQEAYGQTSPAAADAYVAPQIDARVSHLMELTNVAELTGLPDESSQEQGVVQANLIATQAAPAALVSALKLHPAVADVVKQKASAELAGLMNGLTLEEGVVVD